MNKHVKNTNKNAPQMLSTNNKLEIKKKKQQIKTLFILSAKYKRKNLI